MEPKFDTVADELTAYKAQLTDLSAKVVTLESDKATAEKLMGEADARASELAGKLAAAGELIAKADGTVADLTAKLTASETARAEAEQARAKLADAVARNPAYADANAGRKPVGEPDGQSDSDLWAEYNALTHPVARAEFWAKHSDELRKLARKQK
jgi:chromosome segregation ATPase